MRLIVVPTILLTAVVAIMFFARNRAEEAKPVGRIPDVRLSSNDAVVIVEGWSTVELESILADFRKMYRLPAGGFTISPLRADMSRVKILDSLPGDILAYLINYLHYPVGHNLQGRSITAIAIVSRGELFGAPSEFADSLAIVYVPTNDTEYDQVFVRIDPGGYYRISFTRLQWLPVADGREPAAVRRLSNDAFK